MPSAVDAGGGSFPHFFLRHIANTDIVFRQVGAKITYYRTVQGIKQSDLAKKAHISQSSLSKIENGHYDSAVSLDVLLDLAEILNIDFTLFLTFNETERRQWHTEPPIKTGV